MSLLDELAQLVEELTPLVTPEKVGEEKAAALSEKLDRIQKELSNPKIIGNVERRVITSFDDWEERIYGVAEFVRPDNTIIQFKIQSLTSAEQKDLRQKRTKAMPVAPSPRSRGDKIDADDPHYQKALRQYEEEIKLLDEMNVLWVLEKGLVDVQIPGKDDKEKMAFLDNKVAGDAAKIANEIIDLSNLTPETLRPFSRR